MTKMPEWEPAPPSAVLRQIAKWLRQDAAAAHAAAILRAEQLERLAADVDAMERMKEPKP